MRFIKGFFRIRAQRAHLNYSLFIIHFSLKKGTVLRTVPQIVEKVIFRQSDSLREAHADEEKAAVGVRGYGKRLLTK